MTAIRKRVFYYLEAAREQGAFLVSGIFCGLDADDIADEIARDWDAGDRDGKMLWRPGESKPEASDIAPHVEAWLIRTVEDGGQG
ncbi:MULTISPECIES: hypothetical protein [unclassified Bradyrhizobium]|uniref:hypothetical protein n=1 Tax=unclassified Bradyrhizobium TaxID=2631580 RepID=UPI001FF90E5C|nr:MULTISPECIES: hypothetical protein [unclassified Bradyrhizobium]MCK1676663.1 hypothetical protein [Bradyrhizobium sp. 150]UPJ30321.1 hypothetical protein IVB54_15560 [Bradyrhizobium sp. CW1]